MDGGGHRDDGYQLVQKQLARAAEGWKVRGGSNGIEMKRRWERQIVEWSGCIEIIEKGDWREGLGSIPNTHRAVHNHL